MGGLSVHPRIDAPPHHIIIGTMFVIYCRVCTEVCVIVEDYLIAAKEVRIDLEVLVRMRSRRPWLVPRDEVVYNVLQFEQCAMLERNNVGNYEYQLIHEPEYRGALQFLDTGAVLKKLLRVSHRKISIFRSLGRTQEDHPSYDFRDWIWCFGDWYTNCQGRPLKILLDGITIDLRFFLFKIVDRKDGNGNMLFSSVEVRNLTILGGITPPFREGDQRWWGFHPDFVVNIGIDHLSLKRDGRQEKLELELYACIQENYENPMTQELRNELLIFGDEKFGHGGQGRKRFSRIVRLWRRSVSDFSLMFSALPYI